MSDCIVPVSFDFFAAMKSSSETMRSMPFPQIPDVSNVFCSCFEEAQASHPYIRMGKISSITVYNSVSYIDRNA